MHTVTRPDDTIVMMLTMMIDDCDDDRPPGVLLREVLGARVMREAGVQRERRRRPRRRHVHLARLRRVANYAAKSDAIVSVAHLRTTSIYSIL